MRTMEHDRRQYARSKRGITGVLEHDGPGVLNHIDNISANGVLCHTIKPVPLMTKVGMALNLPKPIERRVECEGIVVRCEPHEFGEDRFKVAILYTKIDETDREAIMDFCEAPAAALELGE